MKKPKNYIVPISIGVFATFMIIVVFMIIIGGKTSLKANENGNVTIDVSEVSEKAKFYTYTYEGTKLEFFAVRDGKGTVRMAFNRCQVCYDSGRGYFKQEGDEMVCQNCGNRYKTSSIGNERGGCNPSPITNSDKIVNGNSVEIKESIFRENKYLF